MVVYLTQECQYAINASCRPTRHTMCSSHASQRTIASRCGATWISRNSLRSFSPRAFTWRAVDTLGDLFEGTLPPSNYLSLAPFREADRDFFREMRQQVHVSCWHSGETESATMWRAYAGGDCGGRLIEHLTTSCGTTFLDQNGRTKMSIWDASNTCIIKVSSTT